MVNYRIGGNIMTNFDKFKLENQVDIVKGGATGLGKSLAEG